MAFLFAFFLLSFPISRCTFLEVEPRTHLPYEPAASSESHIWFFFNKNHPLVSLDININVK